MADAADLKDAEVRRLTRRVVAPDANEPFGAYLFCGDDPGAALARYVERTVFLESFGTTPEMEAEAYDPYEPSSAFICVIDQLRGIPVGAMRVVLPSSAGFKSLNDIEPIWGESAEELMGRNGLKVDLGRTWDIATLAVIPDYRGKATRGLVLMGLYQTLTLAARDCGIEWFVAIFDMPVFRLIRWKLRLIFAGYEGIGPMPYLGSTASIPAWCDVVQAERRLAETDQDLHAILVEGLGLEPALRRADITRADRLVAWRRPAASGQ
ncbi:MAG TPA: hypothetical protein VFH61_03895 [Thermoleophilia bacterium]|nr:hypothetical protein [Thermoleophilia bacterium]